MESKITVPNPDLENSIKYPALFEMIEEKDTVIALAFSDNNGFIIYSASNKQTRKIGLGYGQRDYWINNFNNSNFWRPFKGTLELKG